MANCATCGHAENRHFGTGTCLAGHPGEASVCPCLAFKGPEVKTPSRTLAASMRAAALKLRTE